MTPQEADREVIKMANCRICKGTGKEICPVCGGTRKDPRNPEKECGYCKDGTVTCADCGGSGKDPYD